MAIINEETKIMDLDTVRRIKVGTRLEDVMRKVLSDVIIAKGYKLISEGEIAYKIYKWREE